MFNILTLNKISKSGLANFDSTKYACHDEAESPDAIIVRSASMHEFPLPDSVLAVARAGAGYNNIPTEDYAKKGVVCFNTPGANANAVKELTICALLLASRKVSAGIAWCLSLKGEGSEVGKRVEKGKSSFVGPEISGKTLGIVGLGAIGLKVARAAVGLGMQVIATTKNPVELKQDEGIRLTDSLDELLACSDYISLHAPSTAETKGIICKESLAKCKDNVRIINLARGDLVVSDDIIEALAQGKCAAYVTDFPTDEMLGCEGVTALPHLGASTPESEENCAVMAVKQIAEYLENGNIINSVNFPCLSLERGKGQRLCVLCNEDKSAEITAAVEDCNIEKTKTASGKNAYTIVDLKGTACEAMCEKIKAIDGVLALRVL